MRIIGKWTFAVAALWFTHTTAYAGELGVAGNYNTFVFTDLSLSDSVVQGAVAVGGDAGLSDVAVASMLNSGNHLVVDGDLDFEGGTINGSAIISGNTTMNGGGTTGDVTTGGDYTGTGGPTNGGTIYYGGFYTGPPTTNNQQVSSVTLPIDFASEENQLLTNSDTLAATPATGTTTDDANGDLNFTGTESGQNIFSVDVDVLQNATAISIDIPTDASAVINVVDSNGSDVAFLPDASFNFNGAQDVLWNFDDYSVVLGSSFSGSVLAPTSVVVLNNGQFNGTLVANILTSSDELFTIPLPSSVWGGLVLLAGLSMSRRFIRV